MIKMNECDLCGMEMIHLEGPDFFKYACLNHDIPRVLTSTWCHNDEKYVSRELQDYEKKRIMEEYGSFSKTIMGQQKYINRIADELRSLKSQFRNKGEDKDE